MDENNINYWFPRLQRSGMNVPKTAIVETNVQLIELLDGNDPAGFDEFISRLREAINTVGYPAFIGTGHFSGKHDWKSTCFIQDENTSIGQHIYKLVEGSELADFFGLPYQTWAVREFLGHSTVCLLLKNVNTFLGMGA